MTARCLLLAVVLLLGIPAAGQAQSGAANLQRALISFKNHLGAGISYSDYPNAMADLNTEIEMASRGGALPANAEKTVEALQADMEMMKMTWAMRFPPLADTSGEFATCGSRTGQFYASTAKAFAEQGILDGELKTTDLGGSCAYYNDQAIGQLLSALAAQADKTLDALTVKKPRKSAQK